jgi:putative lipoic acid-binding regulatory protein
MFNLKANQEVKVETLNDKLEGKKLELEYPCSWCYKVIASEKEALQKAVKDVIKEREQKVNGEAKEASLGYQLTDSNRSKTGKFVSMNLDMLVHNEDDRQFIYDALKKHQDIKMVL